MRPKVVSMVLAMALLAWGVAFFLIQHSNRQPSMPESPPSTDAVTQTAPDTGVKAASRAELVPPPIAAPVPANPVQLATPEERQKVIDAEVDQLRDWAMNNDPMSLSNILVDLTSPEKEIREAAVEAAKQFGSTNAIPALKAAAAAMDDIQEKIDCLEAANFLSLPILPLISPPPGTAEQMEAQAIQAREQDENQTITRNQSLPAERPLRPAPDLLPGQINNQ